ncbi:hypothetical protein RJ639_046327 [Escallonia herrerae]|uniref:Uncharacterized protein n=1 Tax=Escallonia herrerae TaxID=1293975 RepID=A0AA88W7F2_9ASTE|nr:hypothetical protein RJ639_046327 [Escallonia herrerae]
MNRRCPDAMGKGPSRSIPHTAKGMGETIEVNGATGLEDKRKLARHYDFATILVIIVIASMVIAFMTGLFAVLKNSVWLAIYGCVIGGCSFLVHYYELQVALFPKSAEYYYGDRTRVQRLFL